MFSFGAVSNFPESQISLKAKDGGNWPIYLNHNNYDHNLRSKLMGHFPEEH